MSFPLQNLYVETSIARQVHRGSNVGMVFMGWSMAGRKKQKEIKSDPKSHTAAD